MAINTTQANALLNQAGAAGKTAPTKATLNTSLPPRPGSTPKAGREVQCTSYYLENTLAGHYKFYWVLISDEGHCIFAWGRIGTAGQAKVQKHPSAADAEAAGIKQFYAKASKGYEPKEQGLKMAVYGATLDEAVRNNSAQALLADRRRALQDPAFKGQQAAAAKHYDDFIASAESLMNRAATTPAALLFDDWSALQESWQELSDRHDTASTYLSMTAQIIQNNLMS